MHERPVWAPCQGLCLTFVFIMWCAFDCCKLNMLEKWMQSAICIFRNRCPYSVTSRIGQKLDRESRITFLSISTSVLAVKMNWGCVENLTQVKPSFQRAVLETTHESLVHPTTSFQLLTWRRKWRPLLTETLVSTITAADSHFRLLFRLKQLFNNIFAFGILQWHVHCDKDAYYY